ncbi:MAG: membrane protein insertion efficiency factor YidD [Candidatus Cryptobacteroides sp.]
MLKRRVLILTLLSVLSFLPLRAEENEAAVDYIHFYQKFLSPLKNTHCRMYPSCSAYSKMLFQDYPFPLAMALTADRLTRCGHDSQFYLSANLNGSRRLIDFPATRLVPQELRSGRSAAPSAALLPPSDSSSAAIQFVHQLINQKNYESALLEIERLFYYNPQQYKYEPVLYVDKMKCYEGMGKYTDALKTFDSSPSSLKGDYSMLYTSAHILSLSGQNASSLERFEKTAGIFEANPSEDYVAPYGELALLYAAERDFDKSRQAFSSKLSWDGNESAYNRSLNVLADMQNQKGKKEWLAVGLSIIPGAGYLYTGSFSNAITSLLINSLLCYATCTSVNSKNYGVAVIMGALNLSFYIGNMVGAGQSARRYNDARWREFTSELRNINPYIN